MPRAIMRAASPIAGSICTTPRAIMWAASPIAHQQLRAPIWSTIWHVPACRRPTRSWPQHGWGQGRRFSWFVLKGSRQPEPPRFSVAQKQCERRCSPLPLPFFDDPGSHAKNEPDMLRVTSRILQNRKTTDCSAPPHRDAVTSWPTWRLYAQRCYTSIQIICVAVARRAAGPMPSLAARWGAIWLFLW
jgi:hypothetical protein